MRRHTYVLGTGLSHDGSSCLIQDGRIAVAIEKERLTRRKHDGFNDSASIIYCLEAAGIGVEDLSLVVQNANFSMLPNGRDWFHGPRILGSRVPVVTISHHLAHAFSAIGTCPFQESAVLVIDGCGNGLDDCTDLEGAMVPDAPKQDLVSVYYEKDSYYLFDGGSLRPVFKDFSPWGLGIREIPMCPPTTKHSIGGVYQAASAYVFGGLDDPGKLMGLAPYGRPGIHDLPIFDLRDGRVYVRYDWLERFNRPCRNFDDFKRHFQYYADIAAWVQREVEQAVLYVIRDRFARAPHQNLCYAGGVALNAVANRKILVEGPFRNVYIQPAAADNGLAIGCAYYGWLKVLGEKRVPHDGSTCFGQAYGRRTVSAAIASLGAAHMISDTDDHIAQSAALLAEGKIVAWFQGGSEFGPRALGNRSILADPRSPSVRDFINRDIKCREEFRPFAPAVLAEDASEYFDCPYESPYMLLVAPVRPKWRERLASVVHCDGSARLQIVTEKSSPCFYRLLSEFKLRTGLGILLNTSLNKRRMPIVETPAQAVDFFLSVPLDAMAVEDTVLLKPACEYKSEDPTAHLEAQCVD